MTGLHITQRSRQRRRGVGALVNIVLLECFFVIIVHFLQVLFVFLVQFFVLFVLFVFCVDNVVVFVDHIIQCRNEGLVVDVIPFSSRTHIGLDG